MWPRFAGNRGSQGKGKLLTSAYGSSRPLHRWWLTFFGPPSGSGRLKAAVSDSSPLAKTSQQRPREEILPCGASPNPQVFQDLEPDDICESGKITPEFRFEAGPEQSLPKSFGFIEANVDFGDDVSPIEKLGAIGRCVPGGEKQKPPRLEQVADLPQGF